MPRRATESALIAIIIPQCSSNIRYILSEECPVFVCANLQVKDVLIGTVQDELMSSPPAVSVERLSPRSLIVDKEPIVRSPARSVLSKLGFSVTDTSDGRYALSSQTTFRRPRICGFGLPGRRVVCCEILVTRR